jgi:hypothetical protein
MDKRLSRSVKEKRRCSEILLAERQSLAQGIQIGFLKKGIIDNYAACTVSNRKRSN